MGSSSAGVSGNKKNAHNHAACRVMHAKLEATVQIIGQACCVFPLVKLHAWPASTQIRCVHYGFRNSCRRQFREAEGPKAPELCLGLDTLGLRPPREACVRYGVRNSCRKQFREAEGPKAPELCLGLDMLGLSPPREDACIMLLGIAAAGNLGKRRGRRPRSSV